MADKRTPLIRTIPDEPDVPTPPPAKLTKKHIDNPHEVIREQKRKSQARERWYKATKKQRQKFISEKNRHRRKIISNVKELNRQLGIIEGEQARGTYAAEYKSIDTAFEMMRKLTGTKSIWRFHTGNLSKMSMDKLRELDEYTTYLRGRKVFKTRERREMFNKGMNTLNQRYFPDGGGLTRAEYREFLYMLNEQTLDDFKQQRMLDSDQILEMIIDARGEGQNPVQAKKNIVKAFKEARKVMKKDPTKMKKITKTNPDALRSLLAIFLAALEGKIDENEKEEAITEYKSKYNL